MGRPVNSRFFGADDADTASATYDTDGDAVSADSTVNDPGEITINIVDGGSGYSGNFVVTVNDAGGGSFDVTFTVSGGVVQSGSASNLSGTIDDAQSGVTISIPAPAGETQFQILGTAWIPGSIAGAAEDVTIVRQRSSRTFRVKSVANGDEGEVITADTATPAEGEFSIPVVPSDGSGGTLPTEYARIITNRRVRTFDSNSYKWGERTEADAVGEALPGVDDVA